MNGTKKHPGTSIDLGVGNCIASTYFVDFVKLWHEWDKKASIHQTSMQYTKGQLISKCPFGVFKSPKKPTKFFPGFLP